MGKLLEANPLMVLFLVAATGYVVGQLKVLGFGLGVSAVLFVGLAVGAIDPNLELPELVHSFGLVLFVYTVGLSSGPGFFASFRRRGLRDNGLALGVLVFAAAIASSLALALGLRGGVVAGLFAGALTNTPALASVLESMKGISPTPSAQALADPVVAFSVAQPIGVIGVIAGIYVFQRIWRVDYAHEPLSARDAAAVPAALESLTARVARGGLTRDRVLELVHAGGHDVLFGRMKRGDDVSIVTDDARFEPGDLVSVVGAAPDVRAAAAVIGEASEERLDLDRELIDFRRIFVSSPHVTEKPLSTLRIPQRFGAIVTRVRRGDVELLPSGATELELGDRVRVVAPRDRMGAVAAFFGDSYKALGEIDVITFGVGIALGLLLGSISLPLPGGVGFKLGFAGGPLVVGLLLGRVGRTGSLVWTMSYSANLTLRQLGLVLFLAGIGTRSGYAFVSTLRQGGGLTLLGAGALVTCGTVVACLWLGHRLLKIPMGVLIGIVSGVQTQPAALGFASEQTRNDLPNVGYASVYPLATIAKIVLAQVVFFLFR